MDTTKLMLIGIIAALLITGVAAYGLSDADGDHSDDSGLLDHSDHSKSHKNVNKAKDKNSNGKSSGDAKTEINLDITMQQNVDNYIFNIPTAFIVDIDEYNENSFSYTKVFLPDGDEYDWEVDLEILEFDKANDRNLTSEDVETLQIAREAIYPCFLESLNASRVSAVSPD